LDCCGGVWGAATFTDEVCDLEPFFLLLRFLTVDGGTGACLGSSFTVMPLTAMRKCSRSMERALWRAANSQATCPSPVALIVPDGGATAPRAGCRTLPGPPSPGGGCSESGRRVNVLVIPQRWRTSQPSHPRTHDYLCLRGRRWSRDFRVHHVDPHPARPLL
jgi:hypothetical protein